MLTFLTRTFELDSRATAMDLLPVSGMHDVCAIEDVPEGKAKAFTVAGAGICMARTEGRFRAFEESCTHRHCPLAGSEVDDDVVFCPCHNAEFDLATGEVLAGPARKPLEVYETRVAGGRVWVRLPTAEGRAPHD
jgi:nitrite reductase/ring-hydroxylating ferredoxin subunit